METSQTTTQNQQQTLTLESVPYNDNYRIKYGSVGQLMRGLQEMQNRISLEKESDEYKKTLYPKLRELSQSLVERFKLLLSCSNETENNVKRFNLLGYNGQIRADKYNKYPFIAGVNPNAKYAFSNFGYYLRTIKQRLDFISNRDVPLRYSTDENAVNVFNGMKLECNNLLKYLNEVVEPEWNKVVEEARMKGGDSVTQNLQLRAESREKRLAEKEKRFDRSKYRRNRRPNFRRGSGTFRGRNTRGTRGTFGRGGRGRGRSRRGAGRGQRRNFRGNDN